MDKYTLVGYSRLQANLETIDNLIRECMDVTQSLRMGQQGAQLNAMRLHCATLQSFVDTAIDKELDD